MENNEFNIVINYKKQYKPDKKLAKKWQHFWFFIIW